MVKKLIEEGDCHRILLLCSKCWRVHPKPDVEWFDAGSVAMKDVSDGLRLLWCVCEECLKEKMNEDIVSV